jgi:hypothetical protein
MQPSFSHRVYPQPAWERYGAGHPYANSAPGGMCHVVTRDWTVKGNLSFGTETYIPARLLAGVLPQTLLETHRFWQDEDDQLRGYPIEEDRDDGKHDNGEGAPSKRESMLIFVNLAAGAHVATHGSKWASVRASPETNLPPGRAVVMRFELSRLTAEHARVSQALQRLEEFVKAEGLLAGPFVVNYQLCKGLSTLVRRVGLDAFEQGMSGLSSESLQRLRTKRKRYRVSEYVLPQIMDLLVNTLDPVGKAKTGSSSSVPLQVTSRVKLSMKIYRECLLSFTQLRWSSPWARHRPDQTSLPLM